MHDIQFNFGDVSPMPQGQETFYEEPLDLTQVDSFDSLNDFAPSAKSSSQTVSPQEIMLDGLYLPPSTTMTNLTTPETYVDDSPFQVDSTEASPLFDRQELDGGEASWPPLFEPPKGQPQERIVAQSMSRSSSSGDYKHSPALTNSSSPMTRTRSSPGQNGNKSNRQHSFTSAIRKRDKPLPDIKVEDPNDTVALKRARNTMAARKSREKRVQRQEALEKQVEELTDMIQIITEEKQATAQERDHLKSIVLRHGLTG